MKVTRRELVQLIKEELDTLLSEQVQVQPEVFDADLQEAITKAVKEALQEKQ